MGCRLGTRALGMAIALAFCCWHAGWGQGDAGAAEPVQIGPQIPSRPELEQVEGVRAWRVNGEEISLQQVQERAMAFVGPYILRDMVAATLLAQEAKRKGVVITEAEVQAKARELRAELGLQDDESFRRYLVSELRTPTWFETKVREYLLIEKVVGDSVHVSDAEVRAFYNRFQDAYRRPAMVSYRAMAFPSEAQAQAALAELRKGRPFQEIAKEKATTAFEKSVAGEVLTYQRGQQPALPKELEEALFAAPPGQVIGPIRTGFQGQNLYHLLKVEAKADERVLSLDEVKEVIRAQLYRRKLEEEAYPRWLQAALSSATIEVVKER